MMRRVTRAAAGLLLAASPAYAQTPQAPLWGYLGLGSPAEHQSNIAPSGHAAVSLTQAIEAVQRSGGGRVAEIGFAHKDSATWYAATVARPDGLHRVRVDPSNGTVQAENTPPTARALLDPAGQRDLDAIGSTAVDLTQAVAAAEQATRGQAISTGIEQLAGIPQYYVQTVSKGKLRATIVDPRTGRLTDAGR